MCTQMRTYITNTTPVMTLPKHMPIHPSHCLPLAGSVYTNGASNGPAPTATGLRAPTSLPSAPSQRVLLLSFLRGGGGGHLVALHLVQEPPSLVGWVPVRFTV
jgi:hypothetical protein